MTPQAYSYPTVGADGIVYCPPYGLKESLNYMLSIDPTTYAVNKIPLEVNGSTEKWTFGITVGNKIYWLPYGESTVLVYNTAINQPSYIKINWPGNTSAIKGKYIQGHVYDNKIIALPYGEDQPLNWLLEIDTDTDTATLRHIQVPSNDCKKWHQSVLKDNTIIAAPRGSSTPFNFAIEYNCDDYSYLLKNLSPLYYRHSHDTMKFTTIGILDNVVYAPPYSYNEDFDYLLVCKDNLWTARHTGITGTTRKYFTHVKTKNNKLYFPPAGHHSEWGKFLIINNGTTKTFDLDLTKETKKYFAGIENSQGKVYFIPRGGCVCDPNANLKLTGDLAEVLVVDSKDDSYYTIDISECFTDNTTIEKYNACCIVNDIIFAMPYGESDSFQTVLVFDTMTETIIKTIDLNEIL
jgi:hypothetical protein